MKYDNKVQCKIAKIYNTTSNAVEHWIQRNNIYKKQFPFL